MQRTHEGDRQEEAEFAALEQVMLWRRRGVTLAFAAETLGLAPARCDNWDTLAIEAMRAYRELGQRMDAALDAEAELWVR